jgi:formate hydrogenlyase subunit 4
LLLILSVLTLLLSKLFLGPAVATVFAVAFVAAAVAAVVVAVAANIAAATVTTVASAGAVDEVESARFKIFNSGVFLFYVIHAFYF